MSASLADAKLGDDSDEDDDDYVRASSRKPPAARADSERQVAHRFLPPMARMTSTSRTRSPPSSQRRP